MSSEKWSWTQEFQDTGVCILKAVDEVQYCNAASNEQDTTAPPPLVHSTLPQTGPIVVDKKLQ